MGKSTDAENGGRKTRTETPANFDEYWQMRMEGATLRLRAAQQIVSHPGTRGGLAENLLRELVRDFLPHRWAVGTGFIMEPVVGGDGKISAKRSNQVDLLIYDQFERAPVFKDGDLVILSPGSAKVAVEVKSKLNKTYIADAYDNICSVKAVDSKVAGFIFGYDGVAHEPFANHVKEWAGVAGAPGREQWPAQVFNMGQKFLVWPDPTSDADLSKRSFLVLAEKDPVVRMFLTATLAAVGVDNLRAFFREDEAGEVLHTI